MAEAKDYIIGIDTGGTFTDVVVMSPSGEVWTAKASTTPDEFSRGVMDALTEASRVLDVDRTELLNQAVLFKHGSTVATNALITRTGVKVGFITTRGFEDTTEIMRAIGRVDGLSEEEIRHATWVTKPEPLVPRERVLGVRERIDYRGEVVVPLSREDVMDAIRKLVDEEGCEAIAVSLLHAWANARHEDDVRALAREADPSNKVFWSFGSELAQVAGEYARANTAIINSFLGPTVDRYLGGLQTKLEEGGLEGPFLIMQGNGGVAHRAHATPVSNLQSGPAGGAIASAYVAGLLGHPNVITADMGGTSFDVGLITEGYWRYAAEPIVERFRMLQPIIDIQSIGAGGGTIARVDEETGRLLVGPQSAGASPGPVCYDQGGTETTNTDANLVLGYINPEGLVGGGLQLDRSKAEQCVERQIAAPLGMSLLEAAYGVHLLANSNMTRAVRAVSTERGRDVRNFALIAFGGAGPLHACEMGLALGMKEAVIPPYPGLFSAFGLLSADIEHHYVQTYFKKTREADLEQLNATINRIEKHIVGLLTSQGFSENEIDLHCYADMRYSGQSYELTIPVGSTRLSSDAIDRLEDAYDAEHEKTYGHKGGEGEDYTFVNFRLIGRVARKSSTVAPSRNGFKPRRAGRRQAYFGPDHGLVDTAVLSRGDLDADPREGPLLIDEYDSTTVVPPGCSAWLDAHGNIRIGLQAP